MLCNLSFILLGVAGLIAARPVSDPSSLVHLPKRHSHTHHFRGKREADEVTQIVQEEIVVLVDRAGNPISTSTALGSSIPVQTSLANAQTIQTNNKINAANLAGTGFQKGVTYSAKLASGECKTTNQIQTDVNFLVSQGHDLIRLYGTECDGPKNLQAAVKGTTVWMFLGIFDISQAASGASDIATQLGKDWSQVHTVSIGNEVVQNGGDVGAVVAAIDTTRSTLRGLGYNGPVVTVDTAVKVEVHPELCQKSDYCAVNCHAFWDGNAPDQAAKTIDFHVKALKEKTGMGKVIITESGWPTCGSGDSAATASPDSQAAAIASLKSVNSADIILFSAFNELWKADFGGSNGGEKCWGIYGNARGGL